MYGLPGSSGETASNTQQLDEFRVICDIFHRPLKVYVPGWRYFLTPTRKETSSEACQGRPRFQQHGDKSCPQVFFSPLQGKAPKEIHIILTETLAYFPPGRAKDLSAPRYK